MGPGPTNIARAAEATGPDAIGQRPLPTGSSGICLRQGGCGLPLAGGLEGVVLFTGADRHRAAWRTLRARTWWPMRTWATVGTGKLALDDLVIPMINRRGPAQTGLASRTGCVLLVPGDHKLTAIEAALAVGLPADGLACGPPELHPVVTLARRQPRRIEIPGIDNMPARQPGSLLECGVELGSPLAGIPGGWRGFPMRDEWGQPVLTGCGPLHFVSPPVGGVFPRRMGLRLIGGADETRRRWAIVIFAPRHPVSRGPIMLPPALA